MFGDGNAEEQRSVNVTEEPENNTKKQKKSQLYETIDITTSSENKNRTRHSPYNVNAHIPMFREILKHHIYKNEILRSQKSPSDYKCQQSPSNSYVDFLGQNQNQTKAQKKSLSYDNFKLRKIRALYGKRVTMQINE